MLIWITLQHRLQPINAIVIKMIIYQKIIQMQSNIFEFANYTPISFRHNLQMLWCI